jgi:hypothetical protein
MDTNPSIVIGQTIQRVLQNVDDGSNTSCLLLTGSYAEGNADEYSDLDIIRIHRNGPPSQFYVSMSGLLLDVYSSTKEAIQNQLYVHRRDNNKFLLNALVKSVVYLDREGNGERLVQNAKNLRDRGPEPIPQLEIEKRIESLIRLSYLANRVFARAGRTHDASLLAEMRCADLFRSAVTDYRCIQRKWTSSLRETLEWIRKDDGYFYGMCQSYFDAESLEARLVSAQHIASEIIKQNEKNI